MAKGHTVSGATDHATWTGKDPAVGVANDHPVGGAENEVGEGLEDDQAVLAAAGVSGDHSGAVSGIEGASKTEREDFLAGGANSCSAIGAVLRPRGGIARTSTRPNPFGTTATRTRTPTSSTPLTYIAEPSTFHAGATATLERF